MSLPDDEVSVGSPFTVDPVSSDRLVVRREGLGMFYIPLPPGDLGPNYIPSLAEALESLLDLVYASGMVAGSKRMSDQLRRLSGDDPEA